MNTMRRSDETIKSIIEDCDQRIQHQRRLTFAKPRNNNETKGNIAIPETTNNNRIRERRGDTQSTKLVCWSDSASGIRIESWLPVMSIQHLLSSAYLIAMRKYSVEAAMLSETVKTQRVMFPFFAVVVLGD